MRHLIAGVAGLVALAAAPMSAGAQVVVDATVQVNDHLAVGVRYGHPYVVPMRIYRHPRRPLVVRRVVTLRELERAHWRWHFAHARGDLHPHFAHGHVHPRLHAQWHRAMARSDGRVRRGRGR